MARRCSGGPYDSFWLLRSVKGETEGRPRQVVACTRQGGALRVETRHSRLWILPAGSALGAAACPSDANQRYNAVIRWGAEAAAAGVEAAAEVVPEWATL